MKNGSKLHWICTIQTRHTQNRSFKHAKEQKAEEGKQWRNNINMYSFNVSIGTEEPQSRLNSGKIPVQNWGIT